MSQVNDNFMSVCRNSLNPACRKFWELESKKWRHNKRNGTPLLRSLTYVYLLLLFSLDNRTLGCLEARKTNGHSLKKKGKEDMVCIEEENHSVFYWYCIVFVVMMYLRLIGWPSVVWLSCLWGNKAVDNSRNFTSSYSNKIKTTKTMNYKEKLT